jgi:hypothetical protein
MADIRIKDLATTATTTASDDFMAVDGTTNGTRKMNAAAPAFLTSVTTPSLTSPAASPLTLAGGSSGASLVLGQGTNGGVTITPNGTGVSQITSALLVGQQAAIGASLDVQTASGTAATLRLFQSGVSNWVFSVPASTDALVLSQYGTSEAFRISNNRNVLIGTTSETGLTGAGGLKINSSTAGSAGAGALVVTGGLSAGGASYFGGAVRVNAATGASPLHIAQSAGDGFGSGLKLTRASLANTWSVVAAGDNGLYFGYDATTTGTPASANFILSSTGAATFAGAVTVGGNFTGTSSETKIQSSATAARIRISGGTENDGAGVILGGSTDGGIPNTGILAMAGSTIAFWSSSTLAIASGKALKLGNGYVGTVIVPTGYVTIQDSNGNTYKIAVSA